MRRRRECRLRGEGEENVRLRTEEEDNVRLREGEENVDLEEKEKRM